MKPLKISREPRRHYALRGALIFLVTPLLQSCSKEALPTALPFQTMKVQNLTEESVKDASGSTANLSQIRKNRALTAKTLRESQSTVEAAQASLRAIPTK